MCKPLNEQTEKRQKFVEYFAGDATEAALKAGYNPKSARQQGYLLKRELAPLLKNRCAEKQAPNIASRIERQQFWTKVMLDPKEKMQDRLRASELLGKSECDFTERHEVVGADGAAPAITVEFVRAEDGRAVEQNHNP